jgi:hypothetical protein
MTKSEAKRLLLFHSYALEVDDPTTMETGFLGSLRPFRGKLYEKNFHEVMAALRALADELSSDVRLDREIMSALWSICQLTRAWAIYPGGMLQSNQLITPQQVQLLETWIDIISYTVTCLLEGLDEETAFETYRFYLQDQDHYTSDI